MFVYRLVTSIETKIAFSKTPVFSMKLIKSVVSLRYDFSFWLYIISQKKTRKFSTIVEERVLNVSGKLYTNVLHHTTRINNILI